MLVNGSLVGYFGCSRGVRQADPLSFFFCIADDFLCCYHLRLVEDQVFFLPMRSSQYSMAMSHFLYANDTILFC